MGLNAGGVKVPLLWNNSWHLARKTCHQQSATKTRIIKITVNCGGGGYSASHLLYSVTVIVVKTLIQKGYH